LLLQYQDFCHVQSREPASVRMDIATLLILQKKTAQDACEKYSTEGVSCSIN
jgi:hypothetical protein